MAECEYHDILSYIVRFVSFIKDFIIAVGTVLCFVHKI
jgi:hypothetical protein